jgi:hypothetical protein
MSVADGIAIGDWSVGHVKAAVDMNDLTGEVTGEVAAEEQDHVGDFFDGAEASHGDLSRELADDVLGHVAGHVGIDEAGGDGVDADLLTGKLAGGDLGEGHEAGFAGGVIGLAEKAEGAGDGREIDDAGAWAEQFGEALGNEEGAREVDAKNRIPFGGRHFFYGSIAQKAGVVDEDVQRSGGLADEVGKLGDLRGVADVALDDRGVGELLGKGLDVCEVLAFGVVDVVEKALGAAGGEAFSDRFADAAGCAGDEGGLVGEIDRCGKLGRLRRLSHGRFLCGCRTIVAGDTTIELLRS